MSFKLINSKWLKTEKGISSTSEKPSSTPSKELSQNLPKPEPILQNPPSISKCRTTRASNRGIGFSIEEGKVIELSDNDISIEEVKGHETIEESLEIDSSEYLDSDDKETLAARKERSSKSNEKVKNDSNLEDGVDFVKNIQYAEVQLDTVKKPTQSDKDFDNAMIER
ncbi:hypothetical protein ACLOJK_007407 [Asimina triloba]